MDNFKQMLDGRNAISLSFAQYSQGLITIKTRDKEVYSTLESVTDNNREILIQVMHGLSRCFDNINHAPQS